MSTGWRFDQNTNRKRIADVHAMSEMPTIRVVDVHKRFGALEVLKGVSFDVHRGNVVSMIGASGSGKSTLLRCINHLETPTAGDIFIEGESLCFRGDAAGSRGPRPLSQTNRVGADIGPGFQPIEEWPHIVGLGNGNRGPNPGKRLCWK